MSLSLENASAAWSKYSKSEETRLRSEMLNDLQYFLTLMKEVSDVDKNNWVCQFCSRYIVEDEIKFPVRMPLFRDLLFPTLVCRLNTGEADSARYLAHLGQYLAKNLDLKS